MSLLSSQESSILEIALPLPLMRCFDYLPPDQTISTSLQAGMRFLVPFGHQKLVGVLIKIKNHSNINIRKLRQAYQQLDKTPVLSQSMMSLLLWSSCYYLHPLGEVLASALPKGLRQGHSFDKLETFNYRLTPLGIAVLEKGLQRAPKQQALLSFINQQGGITQNKLNASPFTRTDLNKLLTKQWIEAKESQKLYHPCPLLSEPPLVLTKEQTQALEAIGSSAKFRCFLLEGITGSGKTEVYLQAIQACLEKGQQALVLVPEISLTPQTMARFHQRFSTPIGMAHSNLTLKERTETWFKAQKGQLSIVIGTRSAVFIPLAQLGLIVIDEEHDESYRQPSGFRYHAREIALMRAKLSQIPIVLGSATPSLTSLMNISKKAYQHLRLLKRLPGVLKAQWQLVDIRGQRLKAGLCEKALQAINQHLKQGQQVLVFINRRGYAPALICHHCGFCLRCTDCDANLIWHEIQKQALCHHCLRSYPWLACCPKCQQSELTKIGVGTEQLEQQLTKLFPNRQVVRIDQDTTQRKGQLDALLQKINQQQAHIVVATQILAKGHHFSQLSLVVVVDMDSALFSADFCALEQMGQLLVQVAGRAGREKTQGNILIQTRKPQHALLNQLITQGYSSFAEQLLKERQQTDLPPYAYMACLQVESERFHQGQQCLTRIKQYAQDLSLKDITLLGPMPCLMEKRAGKYQLELLISAQSRHQLHQGLERIHSYLETSKRSLRLNVSLRLIS